MDIIQFIAQFFYRIRYWLGGVDLLSQHWWSISPSSCRSAIL